MKIVTNKTELRKSLEQKDLDKDVVDNISTELKSTLSKSGGVGLSANQIGFGARMCLVNVIDELVLVNPRIIETSTDTIAYVEQCLSIPKSVKNPQKTIRYKTVKVETDNLGIIEFGPTKSKWKDSNEFFEDEGLLECVCVQHEIDHLNGILMNHSSRRYSATMVRTKKIGRNEKVMVQLPDGNTEMMKFKKALPLLEYGCKIL